MLVYALLNDHTIISVRKGVNTMPRKGANIHKRKDGRWEGRYKKGRKMNGKIIYGSVYGKSYREVKEKIALVMKNSDNTTISAKREICFEEVLRLWMENNRIRYKGSTEVRYQYLINTHIIPELGMIPLSALTAPQINIFLKSKLENGRLDNSGGLSSAYVRSIMLIINSALSFAVEEQMCLPLKSQIYKPTITKKELVILNHEQQKKLEAFLLDDLNGTKTGILISLYTGLRIGEVCALTWNDIDLNNSIIYVRHTVARVKDNSSEHLSSKLILGAPKTAASNRKIPISSRLKQILQMAKKVSNSHYIVSDSEAFQNPRTYDFRFHKLLSECGLESINYHALRHTFATRCIEAGVDVKTLSEILGHANVSITLNTYVHSSMELKRIQLEKLN